MAKSWLFTEQGRVYLLDEYVTKQRSTYEIAADRQTYANKVRRALKHHGIELRERGDALKNSLENGRHTHPTKGRKRTDEERLAIREGMGKLKSETNTETNEQANG